MATRTWIGGAQSVPQVETVTPVAANNAKYTITRNLKSVSYTADASASVSEITAGLAAAIANSADPEWKEFAVADVGTALTLTGPADGRPFAVTCAASEGSLTRATTTPPSGPHDWSTAANWSDGTVPVSTDTVVIDDTEQSILYGLNQAGVTLAMLAIGSNFTGEIGLPATHPSGYVEPLPTYLAIGATTVRIGEGSGEGSGRIRIATGSSGTALTVYRTKSPAEESLGSVLWHGTGTNTVDVVGGSVGIGLLPGKSATISTLRIAGGESSSAHVRVGPFVGIANLAMSGGKADMDSNPESTVQRGGDLSLFGSGTIDLLKIDSGKTRYSGTGTIDVIEVGSAGALDFTGGAAPVTVNTCHVVGNGELNDSGGRCSFTAGFTADIATGKINLGIRTFVIV